VAHWFDVLYQAPGRDGISLQQRRSRTQPERDAVEHHALSHGTKRSVTLSSVPTGRIRRCAAWCSPEEQFVKPLGGYNAWFTAPDTVGLDGCI